MRRTRLILAVAVLIGSFQATASAGPNRKFDVPPRPTIPPRPHVGPLTTTTSGASSGTTSPRSQKDRDKRFKDAHDQWKRGTLKDKTLNDKFNDLKDVKDRIADEYDHGTAEDFWSAVGEGQKLVEEIDGILNQAQ